MRKNKAVEHEVEGDSPEAIADYDDFHTAMLGKEAMEVIARHLPLDRFSSLDKENERGNEESD